MAKKYKVYHASATPSKELVFSIMETSLKDRAVDNMNDSRDGFMVTLETETHEEIYALAKWGKNSFSLGMTAREDRIKNKAEAAATLDRLPKTEHQDNTNPEKAEKKVEYNENGNQKRRGRPPVVKNPETPRLYRAYHDERGILVFTSLEYKDLETARAAAHQDETAFVLVNVEQGTNIMRCRGTFNKAFKHFGPNQVVTDATLHDAAIKIIGNRPIKDVAVESNAETPAKETDALKEASDRMDDALKDAVKDFNAKHEHGTRKVEIVEHKSSDETPPIVQLTNQVIKSPKVVAQEVKRVTMDSPSLDKLSPKEIAEMAKDLHKDGNEKAENKPLDPVKTKEAFVALGNGITSFWDTINGKEVEDRPKLPALSVEKPVSADDIYDAIIDNQQVITTLMIEHVEAQGSLKSLDNIVSENERQHGLLKTRMLTLEEESKEAKQKAEAKREELKVITRKIANLLGGAEDATS